jgi:ribonuclease HI
MTNAVRIWLEISHHAAFRLGGWAFVRAAGDDLTGQAGGEPRADAERAVLAGLIAALRGLKAGDKVVLHASSDIVASLAERLRAGTGGDGAGPDNGDLWPKAVAALAASSVQVVRTPQAAGSPAAFAAAWAEFGRDKVKSKGSFAAPIPRANLAKAGVRPAA